MQDVTLVLISRSRYQMIQQNAKGPVALIIENAWIKKEDVYHVRTIRFRIQILRFRHSALNESATTKEPNWKKMENVNYVVNMKSKAILIKRNVTNLPVEQGNISQQMVIVKHALISR